MSETPWWRGATIYQIYPRSFADSNHDGVGDLPGITARLEHVARLGADAIWLSPFFKSPMDDFGYDVADYCDVDPIFGSLADFDALVARAHELGLKPGTIAVASTAIPAANLASSPPASAHQAVAPAPALPTATAAVGASSLEDLSKQLTDTLLAQLQNALKSWQTHNG